MSGVSNGQAVNETVTDPAFIFKNDDDTMPHKLTLANSAEGPTVAGIQTATNKLYTATGASESNTGTDYNAPANTLTNGDSHLTSLVKLADKFKPDTGHTHDGTNGNGGPVAAPSIAGVILKGYLIQGLDLTLSGSSLDVSVEMAGKTPSTGQTVKGVVVTAGVNRCALRQRGGTNEGDKFTDPSGNEVYGRLTWLASVWTLSFYVMIGATETAYSFPAPADAKWYFQQLFNPITDAPVYDSSLVTPSENATADVVPATQTLQGKVNLQNVAAPAIAASGTVGTPDARVANADHTHEGVHSVNGGGAGIKGDVTITGAGGASVSQLSQTITVTTGAPSDTSPNDVSDTAAPGTSSTLSRTDHVHKGTSSVQAFGGSPIQGALIIAGAGGVQVTQDIPTKTITVTGVAAGGTPSDVGSTNQQGASTSAARSDHVHRGLRSIASQGNPALFGDAVLVPGTGIGFVQTGQNITINASSTGGGIWAGTFSTTSITPNSVDNTQESWTYTGTGGTFAGFGTLSGLANGKRFRLIGTSDTQFLTLSENDAANGWLMNGPFILSRGAVIDFEYNSTLARMVECSRNR